MPGIDELMLFSGAPEALAVYEALLRALRGAYPDMEVRPAKTQISLRNRHVFAVVSLPRGRAARGGCLTVSLGLPYRCGSPRIAHAVEAYPNRWTHHVPLAAAEDIDAELLGWLDEAYSFSNSK